MVIKKIGFIGLGAMGKPMARNLIKHGFAVVSIANRQRSAIDELSSEGLIEVGSPRDVGAGSDAVIVMVRDMEQASTVIDGQNGALNGLSVGGLLVVMSTLSLSFQLELARLATSRGIDFLDAPVSGMPRRAEEGTLAIMVGGHDRAIDRFEPAFNAMGSITRCGDVGAGTVAKLANNLVGISTVAMVHEVLAFAKRQGLNKETLLEIMNNSTGGSFVTRNWPQIEAQWPAIRDFFVKDGGLCIEAAREAGIAMPLGELASEYKWDDRI